MLKFSRFLFLAVFLFLISSFTAFADVAFSTLTNVYFTKDGQPYDGYVDYTVSCYGYSYYPQDGGEEPQPGTYTPEEVYSYSATCEEYGCKIYEQYYLNYRHIDYCSLEGTIEEGTFKIDDIGGNPYTECEDMMHQYDMSTGDQYYKSTPEYEACTDNPPNDDIFECDQYMEEIPKSELILDPNSGYPIDIMCTSNFEIPSGLTPLEAIFSDVPLTHENYKAIKYVKDNGIVSGYPDGTYGPDKKINRAEFVKILIGATLGETASESCVTNKDFPDVPADAWYKKYICAASLYDIITGYPDGTFKPANNVNFAEAAKIIGMSMLFMEVQNGADPWYLPYVEKLESIDAVPDSIKSNDQYITRGEMAEMIYRVMNFYSG